MGVIIKEYVLLWLVQVFLGIQDIDPFYLRNNVSLP